MSTEAVALNEHAFTAALTSFFHVSSPPLAFFLSTLVLLTSVLAIVGIVFSIRRISYYVSTRRALAQGNTVVTAKEQAKGEVDVEAKAGIESAPLSFSSVKVNGIQEKDMIEFMPANVVDAYLRLTGRREQVLPCVSPNFWNSGSSTTTYPETIIRPGSPTIELERDTISSNHSWTTAEAYRFVNGYSMTRGVRNTVTSNGTWSARSRESMPLWGSSESGGSRHSGHFRVNHNFRFPARTFSNGSGDSSFRPTPPTSELSSVVSQSQRSPSPDPPHEASTPHLPTIHVEPRANFRPRPATWHAPAPISADAKPTNALRGATVISSIQYRLRTSIVEGTKTLTATDKMMKMSAQKYHDIAAKRWGGVDKESKDSFGGEVGRQWDGAVESVRSIPEEERGKEPTCEEDVEADLADGDVHGMYEDVYLTNVGEKLGKKGKELGRELALYEKTNTYRNRMYATTTSNIKSSGNENSDSDTRSPLPPVTESCRAGGEYNVKQGMKRHRQLRPSRVSY